MSKEKISIPEGNVMRVAAIKGKKTFSDLKEATRVDRKTLRAINAGQSVKRTTLQSIADKLRIPIAHLLASDAADKTDASGSNDYQYVAIKLQRLDGTALRKLAEDAHHITWALNVDQMSTELEATLLKLREDLSGWFHHMTFGLGDPEEDNLPDQIAHIKTSAEIGKCVEELARRKLKIFGNTYVFWDSGRVFQNQQPLPILKYNSELRAALSITPEDKTNSTVHVGIGWAPPREFRESNLVGIDVVEIDGTQVWSRGVISKELREYLGIQF